MIKKLMIILAIVCFALISHATAQDDLTERVMNGHFDQVSATYEQLLLDEEQNIFSPPWPEGWSSTDEGFANMYWEADDWQDSDTDYHATVILLHDSEFGGAYTILDATGGQYVEITLGNSGNEEVAVYLDDILIGTISEADSTAQFDISNEVWTSSSILKFNSNGDQWSNSLVRSISLMASDNQSEPTPTYAYFTADKTTGMVPLTVQFTGITNCEDVMTWSWDFGDESSGSTEQNPVHTFYALNGLVQYEKEYTISLNVFDYDGIRYECIRENYIVVTSEGIPPQEFKLPSYPNSIPPTDKPYLKRVSVESGSVFNTYPEKGVYYYILADVYNPTDDVISATMACNEETLTQNIDDINIESTDPVTSEEKSIYPSTSVQYRFPYMHEWDWAQQIEEVRIEYGIEEAKIQIISFVLGSIASELPASEILTAIETNYNLYNIGQIINNISSVVSSLDFRYIFTSEEIAIPDNFNYDIKVTVNKVKGIAWSQGIYEQLVANTMTILGTLPELLTEKLGYISDADELIKLNKLIKLLEKQTIALALNTGEIGHSLIADIDMNIAIDPDFNYKEPVILEDPIVIPEIENTSDTPVKKLALKTIETIPHTKALNDYFVKYVAAKEANDTQWETILLKDCYHYTSILENDFQKMEVLSAQTSEYLHEIGINPTPEDVEAMKAIIQENGLPEFEIEILKDNGYTDSDIESLKSSILETPNDLIVNYSTTFDYSFNFQVKSYNSMLKDMAIELGEEAPPYANFTAENTVGLVPLTVAFTDESLGSPEQRSWDFGDGQNSNEQNPVHTYTTDGAYTVSLTVVNANGEDTRTRYEMVTVDPNDPPIANFTASPLYGTAPLEVTFNDASRGGEPDGWFWDFGDGQNSNEQNPVHSYTMTGLFNVSLTASNVNGEDTCTKYGLITIGTNEPPIANFTAGPLYGTVPLEVAFNDTSGGEPENWLWDFGDGQNSDEQNPVHTYNTAGIFNISLTASNVNGEDNCTKYELVTVVDLKEPPDADFIAGPLYGAVPLEVTFTDTSTGGEPDSWLWEFGDGQSSDEQNPAYTYQIEGVYTISLTAENSGGISEVMKPNYIIAGKKTAVKYIGSKITTLKNLLNNMEIHRGTKNVLKTDLRLVELMNEKVLKDLNKNRENKANFRLGLEDKLMKIFEHIIDLKTGKRIDEGDAAILIEKSGEIRELIEIAKEIPL